MSNNASDIVSQAQNAGSLVGATRSAVKAVEAAKELDSGIEAGDLDVGRAFLVQVLIDDSGSVRGFEDTIFRSYSALKDELQQAADEAEDDVEILITVAFLNGGVVQPYDRVEDCVDLSDDNFRADGGTPLMTRSFELLGLLNKKVAELADIGINAQTFSCIISDGAANDERCDIPRDSIASIRDVNAVISGLTESKEHILCGVSIGGAATGTFRGMGIHDKWILEPDQDSYAFDAALRKVSRASRSASKSAGAFHSLAREGFDDNEDFGGHR